MGRDAGPDERIRRQRVKRRLPFAVLDKLGSVLLVAVLLGVPVAVAWQLTNSLGGAGRASQERLQGQAESFVEAAEEAAAAAGAGTSSNQATGSASKQDSGAAGVSDVTRERARSILSDMSPARRKALYERYRGALAARGIEPEQIERALRDAQGGSSAPTPAP